MSIATSIQLKGLVEIGLHKRGGQLIEVIKVPNKIVDYGLDLMSRLMVSAFINDAVENFQTLPIQAIAVGTGATTDPVDVKQTALETEWGRQRIEEVEILRAGYDVADAADAQNVVLKLSSKIHGAYGNRIHVEVLAPIAPNNYHIRITDNNDQVWDGSAWVAGAATPRDYQAETLSDLLASMSSDPTVEAFAPNLSWSGTMATNAGGSDLSGGGTGVVVTATFHNSSGSAVQLTEAALYTDDSPGQGIMFNMVRFPGISVTNDLDISFRWKLLFQQA